MPTSDDPLNRVLNHQPTPFVPVAPLYDMLGPVEFHLPDLRWRKWRARLDEAGTNRLAVDFQAYFDVEYEVYCDILDGPYPPPTWLHLPTLATREEIEGCFVVRQGEELTWIAADGKETPLLPGPAARQAANVPFNFWDRSEQSAAALRKIQDSPPRAEAREPTEAEVEELLRSGGFDLARALLLRHPNNLPLYVMATAPYISLIDIFGFTDMMQGLREQPDLMLRMIESYLPQPSAYLAAARRLGIGVVFLQECLSSTDLISPEMFLKFSYPFTRQTIEFYHARGFKVVYYITGSIMPLLEYLRELPFAAFSVEEDRKCYGIDLAEIRRALGPDRVLFGNVDARFLELASDEEVLKEARRQIAIGGPRERFVLSVGSPITPDTALERVRFFCRSTRII